MAKFYGEKQIVDSFEDDDHVVMHFKEGGVDRIPKKMYDVSVTKKSTDLSNLWERQLSPVVKDILQLLLDWDIKLEQRNWIIQKVEQSLGHNLEKGSGVLWGKPVQNLRMSDVDKVLKSENEQEDED